MLLPWMIIQTELPLLLLLKQASAAVAAAGDGWELHAGLMCVVAMPWARPEGVGVAARNDLCCSRVAAGANRRQAGDRHNVFFSNSRAEQYTTTHAAAVTLQHHISSTAHNHRSRSGHAHHKESDA